MGQGGGVPDAGDLVHPRVGDMVGDVPRAGGEEGLGVRSQQHRHRSLDRAEHGRVVSGRALDCHGLLEEVEQVRDVAACGLEVAGVLGHGDLFVVEGKISEGASRSRQPAVGGQLGRAGDGGTDRRLLLLVEQTQYPGLEGRHRGHSVGLCRRAECIGGAAGPPHQSGRFPDAVDVGEDVVDDPTEAEVGVIAAEATAPQARQVAGEPAGQVSHHPVPVEVAIADGPLQEHQRRPLAVHGPTDGDAVGGGHVVGALVAHRCLLRLVRSCLQRWRRRRRRMSPDRVRFGGQGVLQVAAGNLCGQLRASVDVHLGVDAGQVLLDRVDGDEQALTDLGVGVAFGDQPHEVELGWSQ